MTRIYRASTEGVVYGYGRSPEEALAAARKNPGVEPDGWPYITDGDEQRWLDVTSDTLGFCVLSNTDRNEDGIACSTDDPVSGGTCLVPGTGDTLGQALGDCADLDNLEDSEGCLLDATDAPFGKLYFCLCTGTARRFHADGRCDSFSVHRMGSRYIADLPGFSDGT